MGQVRANVDDELLGKAYDSRIAKRLLGFVGPYRKRIVFTILTVLISTIAELLLPKLFSMVIDEVDAARRMSVVNVLGTAFVITVIVRYFSNWGQYYNTQWIGGRV